MLRIIAVILSLQLVGCITTITKGEQFDTKINTVMFSNSEVVGQRYVKVFETRINGENVKETYGLQLDQGNDSILIQAGNITGLESDIKISMLKVSASPIVLPSFSDIQKGYSIGVMFVNGKRLISLKTGSSYFVFDDTNAKKLLSVVQEIIIKNSNSSALAVEAQL